MKILFYNSIGLILLFFGYVSLFAQTQEWQWATQAGGIDWEETYSITNDEVGNTYVVGNFHGTAFFGSYSITSDIGGDTFVAKMDINGDWIWVTQTIGLGDDNALGITLDNAGNIILTGNFQETTNFGNLTLSSCGDYDIFVAKLDCDGNWIWATQAGGADVDSGYKVSTDNSGNLYVVGYFSQTATFGNHSVSSEGSDDVFVAQLDSDGNWNWVAGAGGDVTDYGLGITTNNEGLSYITGQFGDTAFFGANSITCNGWYDIFVAQIDEFGNWIWATQAGGPMLERSYGIAIDNVDNIYISGHFQDTAIFGEDTLISDGSDDVFVSKLSSDGNWMWSRRAGSVDSDRCFALQLDYENNPLVTGYIENTAMFGNNTVTFTGMRDIFVAALTQDGEWNWAIQAGGSNVDSGHDISIDTEGNFFVTGIFSSTAQFGINSITSMGEQDIFIAKLANGTYFKNETIPLITTLSNYPNPFNPSTTIEFSIQNNSPIDISIYNIKGQKINTLTRNEFVKGDHSIIWNGDDEYGNPVSSGIYYYKLNINGKTEAVKKCLLLK
jgi:hypothetical protein